jgi:hypothetical protein
VGCGILNATVFDTDNRWQTHLRISLNEGSDSINRQLAQHDESVRIGRAESGPIPHRNDERRKRQSGSRFVCVRESGHRSHLS